MFGSAMSRIKIILLLKKNFYKASYFLPSILKADFCNSIDSVWKNALNIWLAAKTRKQGKTVKYWRIWF